MKNLLILLPLLFSSACSSVTYISECLNKENNYINKDLIEAYNKEKTVFIDDKSDTTCTNSRRCRSLIYNDRWQNIEIYLSPKYNDFPSVAGLYSISRDYTFKNCINNFSSFSRNIFESKNGNFCLSAKKIENPSAKVKFMAYEKRHENSYNNTVSVKIVIILDNEKLIENNSVVENTRMGQSICERNDLSKKIIMSDF